MNSMLGVASAIVRIRYRTSRNASRNIILADILYYYSARLY